MTDLVNLGFRADTSGLLNAQRQLNNTARAGGRVDAANSRVTSGFLKMAGALGVTLGAMEGFKKLVDVTRQFDVLNAQLVTATGGAAQAAMAFESIQGFAAKTPYDLAQVTDGFTKLVNLGLTPSEKALTSYGNTASAMGKDLNQLIEAVADAATGEFERLKEFGIKSKSEGDNVSFTFRGVTKTVKKEAASIEQYLMALGENEFAGAMSNRIDTLDGKMSNFGDSWDMLFLNISQSGVGDVMKSSVEIGIDALESMNSYISSGQLSQSVDMLGVKFAGFANDVENAVIYINNLFDIATDLWGDDVSEFSKFVGEAFRNMPENIRSAIQLMGVEIATLVDYGSNYGEAFAQVIGIKLAQVVEESKAYGKAIGIAINPFSDESSTLDADLARLAETANEMTDNIFKNASEKAEMSAQIRRDMIVGILEEKDAAIEASDDQIDKIAELGLAYKLLQEQKAADTTDTLKQFKVQSEGIKTQTDNIEEYSQEMQDLINGVDGFGGAWTRTGNVVVDAFGDMGAALGDYIAMNEAFEKRQKVISAEAIRLGEDNAEVIKQQKDLNEDRMIAEVSSYKTMASAASSMFSEKTAAAKAFNAINQVMAAAEIALNFQKITSGAAAASAHVAQEGTKQGANALTAVTSAFAAPFPANFAMGAAMIAIMSGLGVFSGGGSSYEMPEEGGTGTVLGDSSAQSNSINNALEDFEDVQIDQLAELRGIRNAMSGLASGIQNLAQNFSSSLNFSDSDLNLKDSQLNVGAGGLGAANFAGALALGFGAVSAGLGSIAVMAVDKLTDGLISGLLGGISSKKQKLVDSGISFMTQTLGSIFDSGALEASMYQVIETTKKKLWGLSKSSSTKTENSQFDNAISQQMADIFGFIGDSVIGAAESLGLDTKHIITTTLESLSLGDALAGFQIDIGDVSFKDKTGEEIQEELNAIFSQQADLITQYLAPSMSKYQEIGEGLFETLTRVAQEQAVFNDAIGRMGKDLSGFSAAMQIHIGQSLIDLIGTAEDFSDLTSSYFESFYSDAEQLENLEGSLSDIFEQLGVPLSASKEQFRALMDGIDITTEAGRELFAALLEINPAMAEYLEALEDLASDKLNMQIQLLELMGASEQALALQREMELAEMDESLRALQLQIWAQEDLNAQRDAEIDALNEQRQLLEDNVAFAEQQLEKARDAENERFDFLVAGANEAYNSQLAAINAQRTAYSELISGLEGNLSDAKSALEASRNAEIARINAITQGASDALGATLESINAQRSAYNLLISELESGVNSAASKINASLSAELSHYDNLINAVNDRASQEIDAINSASSARLSALNAERSIVQGIASQYGANSIGVTISEALNQARQGNFSPSQNINLGGNYSNATDARIGAAREAFALAEIGKLADAQLSDIDRSIAATERSASRQVESINGASAEEVAQLEAQKQSLQDLVNETLGIDTSVLSLNDAIALYQAEQLKLDNEIGKGTLESLQAQEESANALFDEISASNQLQLDALNAQIDGVLGIDNSVLSLADAIAGYQAAQAELDTALNSGTLEALQAQEDLALKQLNATIEGIEQERDLMNQQVDQLLNIDNSVLSVGDAIEMLLSERQALADLQYDKQLEQIEAQYATIDAVNDIIAAIQAAADAMEASLQGLDLSKMSGPFSGNDGSYNVNQDSQTANEIKALRKDLDNANQQIAANTAKTANSVRQLTYMR